MCRIRLILDLTALLIQSGVQSISAQNVPAPLPFGGPPSLSNTLAAPAVTASDLAAVRDAIGFATRGRPKDATDAQQRISDPTARKYSAYVVPQFPYWQSSWGGWNAADCGSGWY